MFFYKPFVCFDIIMYALYAAAQVNSIKFAGFQVGYIIWSKSVT